MPASSFVIAHAVANVGWRTWTVEPGVALPLIVTAVAYAYGTWRLWRAAGTGAGISRLQASAFAVGCLALVAALMSPLDALSDALFSAHMIQHELLMVVAAPLMVFAAPGLAFMWALPAHSRKRLFESIRRPHVVAAWAVVTAPATVWLLHAVAVWVWHLPELYEAALENDIVHAAQHLSFFATAALFWWGIAHSRYGRLGYGAAVLYVFATALHSGVLGALLTFSATVWYPTYATTAAGSGAWGLTPLEDQQLAGLIMWVPAGLVFVGAGLAFFAAWLRESDRRVRVGAVLPALALFCVTALASAACSNAEAYRNAAAMTGGDPERGRQDMARYGCDTCHTIPGIRTARGLVGPPLTSLGARVYIAGHIPNTPSNLESWIQHPHAHDPQTAMPDTGVTDADARDMAAYLYTLK
jgi:cytochrome c oxidase assembly factor CtaG